MQQNTSIWASATFSLAACTSFAQFINWEGKKQIYLLDSATCRIKQDLYRLIGN